MSTAQDIKNWLQGYDPVQSVYRDPIRVVLAEIQYVQNGVTGGTTVSTMYLSSRPYSSSSRLYDACITGGITFSESISITGGVPNIGIGDIEVNNPGVDSTYTGFQKGLRDGWLNHIWANKQVVIKIGDLRWNESDFFTIFTGLVKDVNSKNRTSLNFILVDNMQRQNVAITETVLSTTAGSSNNQQPVPLTFGECFNVTPAALGVVSGYYTYQVHNGPIQEIIEVRDNGAPVTLLGNTVTDLLSEGKFQLARSPVGTITCSVRGATVSSTYQSKIAEIIKNILVNYGRTLVENTYINTTNFTGFDTNTPANVGIYINDRQNVLEVCSRLANSIGAVLVLGLDGKFKLTQLKSNYTYGTGTHTVTPTDMEPNSFTIREKVDVQTAVKLGYCKNWTVQSSGLAGGIPQSNLMIFSRDYYYINKTDTTLIGSTYYNQSPQPPVRETLLTNTAQADTECQRLLDLYKTPRYVYTCTFYSHLLTVELGDTINIKYPRFGLETGKTGTIVEINRDWLKGRVTLGIFI